MSTIQEIITKQDAIGAVIDKAARALLELWPRNGAVESEGKERTPLGVQQKADDTLVTQADYQSNEILMNGLRELFPNSLIISEEAIQPVCKGQDFWLIDPLDGTSGFINGDNDFAILVSYIAENGRPLAGWVAFPAIGELYAAVDGEFSCVPEFKSECRIRHGISDNTVYIRMADTISSYDGQPKEVMPPGLHSGEAFRRFMRGEVAGVIIELGRLGTWDVAAPFVIFEALGAAVENANGEPFIVSSIDMKGETLLACHQNSMHRLRELYCQIWKPTGACISKSS